jgi:hypothetical protein
MSRDGEEVSKTELPSSVERFLKYVAMQSAMYDNCLNYREEDRIKADMMNCPSRWKPNSTFGMVSTKNSQTRQDPRVGSGGGGAEEVARMFLQNKVSACCLGY